MTADANAGAVSPHLLDLVRAEVPEPWALRAPAPEIVARLVYERDQARRERDDAQGFRAAAIAENAALRAEVARQQAIIGALMPDAGRHTAACPTCNCVGSVDPERE